MKSIRTRATSSLSIGRLNSQTGAIRIAASFPNPGNILRPGQFGRVKAETAVLHDAVLVPQVAVTEFQGQEQVYTVGANNTVHVNNVTLGPQYGDSWVVESGLPGGSLVIVDNLQKLREGAPVSPQPTKFQVAATSHATQPSGEGNQCRNSLSAGPSSRSSSPS